MYKKWSIHVLCLVLLMSTFLSPVFVQKAHAAGEQKPFPQQASFAGITKPNHLSQSQLNADVIAYYNSWKSSYLKNNLSSLPGGYYVKGEITGEPGGYKALGSSEGQGYGMLITVLMAGYDPNAKTIYDGLFKTARAYKSKGNPNLMGWVVADSKSAQGDFYSATDGDLDIAYSLILAHDQWGSSGTINYLAEAKKMITDGIKKSNVTTNNRLNLGDWDSKSALNTRPSDWMLSHLRAFYEVTGDSTWLNVINNLYNVYSSFSASYSPNTGLISDFVVDNPPKPAPRNYLEEFPETDEYNYNAARVPLRIVMDYAHYGETRAKSITDKLASWIKGKTSGNPNNIKDGYKLNGTVSPSASGAEGVFVAPFISAGTPNSGNQAWINSGWDWMKSHKSGYYSDSFTLLNMLFISGNWWKPGGGGNPADTQAPTVPSNLAVTAKTSSSISLSWNASTDNVGVTGYEIYNGSAPAASVTGTNATISGLSANTAYTFTVKAKDAAGNISGASNAVTATTNNDTSSPNLALNKTAVASSSEASGFEPAKAFDGSLATRWASAEGVDPQWIYVDLGAVKNINRIQLNWEEAYAKSYKIQISVDNGTPTNWTDVFSTTIGNGAIDDIAISNRNARYVRMYGTARGTPYGYSLYEFEVYGTDSMGSSDTETPTVPTNLAVTNTTSSSVTLSWGAATDNVGVTGYDVYEGATLAATVTDTTATVSGLNANATYTFTVKAKDAAGNVSAASNEISATTSGDTVNPVKLTAIEDSFVRGGTYAGDQYGSQNTMTVKLRASNASYDRAGYLKFDTTSLSGSVSSAILKIYVTSIHSNTSSYTVEARGINNDAWSETSINATNQPTEAGSALGTVTVSQKGAYVSFDVTSFVNSQSDGVVSFRIVGLDEDMGADYATKEHSDTAIHPVLIINGD